MSEKSVGVLIVGHGLITRFHAKAVEASAKMHLVGMVGRGDDLDAALSNPDVGLCLVANASGAHDAPVLAAARHRVPVLVEKPMAITAERCDRMTAACAETGTPLGCIFQTRWTDAFRSARAAVDSGELGRITFARVDVPWWRADEYYSQSSWHGTWEMDGGGALMNQAIHMVDWLCALMPPVVEVKGFTATLAHPMETEDTATAAIRFEGGALGAVYATTASFPGRGKRLEITGTKGTFVYEDDAHGVSRPDHLDFKMHQDCFEAFVDSFQGGAPYPIGPAAGRAPVALIEQIYGRDVR